jgi:hypothetical protein
MGNTGQEEVCHWGIRRSGPVTVQFVSRLMETVQYKQRCEGAQKNNMNNKLFVTAFLLAVVFVLQSCEVVGGIFKAGAATGIIVVVAVVALIIFVISRAGKK